MMSKRNLYKPAPSQTPPRLPRRSLTQGRLVSTDPRGLLDNLSPSSTKNVSSSLNQHATTTPRAKRSLDYHALSSATTSEQHTPSSKITPTIVKSPIKVKPSSSLSLSDTEVEVHRRSDTQQPRRSQLDAQALATGATVLTVDASQRHSSFKDNEVPITTSYHKSPAKVVCHSPMRNATRNMITTSKTSDYGHAGKMKIPIDSVPTMTVLQENERNNDTQSSVSPTISEGSVSTVAGSPVDPRSKAIETMVARETNNPKCYVSFLDDGRESVSEVDTRSRSLDHSDQEVHVTQPKFDDTVISSIAGDSTINNFADDTMRKKKRKPRVVQSKYMTSVTPRMAPKTSANKKLDARSKAMPSNKPNRTVPTTSKAKKLTTTTKLSSKSVSKKTEKADHDERKEKARQPKFTSTPSDVGPVAAVSANRSEPVIPPAPVRSSLHGERSLLTPSKEQPQKKTAGKSQLDLDLEDVALLQWQFLRSKFKHNFEIQEKEAQHQMYSMWQINQELREKICQQRIELETKEKLEKIDQQLEMQLSWLKSIDHHSSRLIPDYNNLFAGIDSTRHHIVVKDVLLPDNEVDLLSALDDCENILGEITSLLQDDQDKVLSFSDEMAVLADTVQEETKEHDRCVELLSAKVTLATQEQSLQADLIQRKEA